MKSRCFVLSVMFALAAVTPNVARADSGETPPTIEGAKSVAPQDVQSILGKALVLDVRKRASYLEGRLPGAKSISSQFNAEKKAFDAAVFGPDKAVPIVIYGHGSDGWSSVYAVRSAVAAGYSDVRWMRTGWASWVERKLPVEQ
jgi:rhodanese-related sulfurtransferase